MASLGQVRDFVITNSEAITILTEDIDMIDEKSEPRQCHNYIMEDIDREFCSSRFRDNLLQYSWKT